MPARNASHKTKKDSIAPRLYFVGFIVFVLAISALNIIEFIARKPRVVIVETDRNDIVFWENIQKKNPTFRDAYLVLSKIKESEGDVLSAQDLRNEALKIDPYMEKF